MSDSLEAYGAAPTGTATCPGLPRTGAPHRREVVALDTVLFGVAGRARLTAVAVERKERLRAERGDAHGGEVARGAVHEVARDPARTELGVEVEERLDLEVRVEALDDPCLRGLESRQFGPFFDDPLERREVERHLLDAVGPRPLDRVDDHALVDTVGPYRVAPHRVEREAAPGKAGDVSLKPDRRAARVATDDHHAVAIPAREQVVERHREPALGCAGAVTFGDPDEGPAQRRIEIALAVDLGGEPEVLRAVERLAHRPHGPTLEAEGRDIDHGLVAEIVRPHPGVLVQRETVATGTHDRRSPTPLVTQLEETPEGIVGRVGRTDRVTRSETHAVDVPVRDPTALVAREDVLLVVTQRERVERVAVGTRNEVPNTATVGVGRRSK